MQLEATFNVTECLRKQAERDGAYRVAKRLQAVVLNSEGRTSGELAHLLGSPRSPLELTSSQRKQLDDILESGPVAYGLDTRIWTSPMIAWVIEEEFGIHYHPGHVCKLLHRLGFSVQRPRRVLARANADQQDRWQRYTYPSPKKNAAANWALIFSDEASFRQDSTLHATWSRIGCPPEVPVTGQRKSVKNFRLLNCGRLDSITGKTPSSTLPRTSLSRNN